MRILIGFILALSVSFACDQPYEEVGGYKIGCPFKVLGESIRDKSGDNNVKKYKEALKDSFFDEVNILVLNGNIESLSFIREFYDKFPLESVQDGVIASLIERWGSSFNEEEAGRTKLVKWKFEDGIVYSIVLERTGDLDVNSLSISYTSFALKDYHDDKERDIKQSTKEKLKGF